MTHISYETAKKLKEFLGESAPEPMFNKWWAKFRAGGLDGHILVEKDDDRNPGEVPAYMLHDLLSNPFCEAMEKKHPHARYFDGECEDLPWEINLCLNEAYYNGGFASVEKALCEMMEDKWPTSHTYSVKSTT